MEKIVYNTKSVCARRINIDIEDDRIVKVKFEGGCAGNTQGVAKLVEGRDVDEVISLLSGIKCRGNTSCPDQLARALIKLKESK